MRVVSSSSRRTLLRNGVVHSPGVPPGTALLTVGDQVTWVGTEPAAAAHVDSVDEVVDLAGRLVTAAFVDAHVHLAMTGRALASLDLSGASSLAEALVDLEAYAGALPSNALVFAGGWDETDWPEQRPPTTSEVDAAVGDRVAYLARVDSHSAVISSALLARDPSISAQPGWRGDGRVARDAHHAVRRVTAMLEGAEERSAALLRALRFAASRGIAAVHELNAPHISPFEDFELLRQLQGAEPLPQVVPYWGELLGGDAHDDSLLGFAGDLCVDGSIGSRTAGLREPYNDAETNGHLYLHAAEIRDHVVRCTEHGLQAGFHVIGDRALDEVIDGFRAAAISVGAEAMVAARHRLEHVEMPTPAAIATMAALGVLASVQPAFDAAWGAPGELYEQRLGRDRAARMNPFASMHAAGVRIAFGSDSPVTPFDPWAGVRAATLHSNPDERLDVATAFAAATAGGYAACRRDDVGVLAAGSEATYAVWEVDNGRDSQGLPQLSPTAPLPRCVRTTRAGTVIFSAEEAA